ncbi:eukaryotic translation initiation factor eIF2A-domain-containing protein [Crepidotus variabilis]|uniref:Eukaryotic translation initiation factor 2A n=1 Tax=Crepidotus variabilis TaxID=179855 RepID=A0A9P6EGA9_9AGAR|nr:eukaryotic translation initiation factor eIF2A-domain-containing protein [Crepidotus variabilis]
MAQISQQYSYRAQKALGLVNGTPDYAPVAGFEGPEVSAKTQSYSLDGRLYAYVLPTVVRIFQAEGAKVLQELPLSNIVEINFSPRGTYLSTWERPVKLEDGAQHKNLRVFSVSTGEELISFTQKSQDGWDLQYTISESHAIRLVSSEIQVYRPSEWNKGISDKLKVEGSTSISLSPGLNPSVAVFVAEKKGAPASIKIYGLSTLGSPPTCQKTFFKADRAQIKWNTLGTQVLLLTQTEVDNSNKSYYGETGMYLLSAAGNFDCRVTLDKEGPIHDFAWSPNSKEFGVVYGYMPAKTMIFDQRVRTLHDFGMAPHNFISFNPQSRLIALAGFGNLAGKIDIFDRRSLTKVCTIDAPNTSFCDWSPDGRFLLTATLSPRLRVDNGIKVWHCTGPLMHIQMIDELYHTCWRPTPVENVPQFGQAIPFAPPPCDSVKSFHAQQKPAALKPAGAYRPPGARGLATPSIFKREDEGGPGTMSGSSTPPRYSRSPVPGAPGYGQANGNGHHQHNGRRHVPGAPPSGSPSPAPDSRNKRKKGKKEGSGTGPSTPAEEGVPDGPTTPGSGANTPGGRQNGRQDGQGKKRSNGGILSIPMPPPPPTIEIEAPPLTPVTPGGDGSLDPIAKKARNLTKKLKAIEELKDKSKRGERLEATQLRKIDGEAEIRKELATLGL